MKYEVGCRTAPFNHYCKQLLVDDCRSYSFISNILHIGGVTLSFQTPCIYVDCHPSIVTPTQLFFSLRYFILIGNLCQRLLGGIKNEDFVVMTKRISSKRRVAKNTYVWITYLSCEKFDQRSLGGWKCSMWSASELLL